LATGENPNSEAGVTNEFFKVLNDQSANEEMSARRFCSVFGIWDLGFDSGIRISDFGLRNSCFLQTKRRRDG
jgi:hypothetical protein